MEIRIIGATDGRSYPSRGPGSMRWYAVVDDRVAERLAEEPAGGGPALHAGPRREGA